MTLYQTAQLIASHIPGAIACPMHDADGNTLENRAKLALPDGGAILLIVDWRGKGKALVHIATRDLDYGSAPDMPECGFSPDADPKRIAAHISRSLLPHVPDLLARVEVIRTAQQTRRDRTARTAADIESQFASLTVRTAPDNYRAEFYHSEPFFGGHINSNGSIYFTHLSVSPDRAQAVLAALIGSK